MLQHTQQGNLNNVIALVVKDHKSFLTSPSFLSSSPFSTLPDMVMASKILYYSIRLTRFSFFLAQLLRPLIHKNFQVICVFFHQTDHYVKNIGSPEGKSMRDRKRGKIF